MSTLADLLIKVGIDPKGVDKGSRQMESKLSKTWDGVKLGALAAGAAAGAALMAGMQAGLDAEAAIDKMNAGLGLFGPEAEALGKTAGDLYKKGLGQSMEDVATAVGAVKSSFDNLSDTAIEKASEKALNFAKAFEVDVARAAQVASQAVTSGLAVDATQAFDLLTASAQKVPAALREDLLDAVDEYGPFITSIGISGPKAFGLLTKAAEKGMYGIDKTGDALKEFTIRATDMSKASKAGYDALGMSQEEMSRKLLRGGETGAKAFDDIIAGLVKMKDPVAQSQAALALFGTPLEDLSVTEIPKFLEQLNSSKGGLEGFAGAADKMGESLNDNAKTKLAAFQRQVEGALVEQLAKAIPYIEATFGWLQRNSGWVTPLAIGLGALAAAIGVMVAAQWAWNAALAVSPVTWIVLAVVALIAVIVYLVTKTQFFQTIWAAVWGFMKTVGAWFAGPFANFFVQLWNRITSSLQRAKGQFMTVINFIKGLFIGWLSMNVTVANKIIGAFGRVVTFFRTARTRISGALSGMWDGLKSGFRTAINWVISKWNSISFSVPNFTFMGKNFGGGTVSVPKIPQLADGGIVRARPGGTLVNVGEGGQDEAVVPLGRGSSRVGSADDRPVVVEVVPGGESEFRRWVNKSIRVKGELGGKRQVA